MDPDYQIRNYVYEIQIKMQIAELQLIQREKSNVKETVNEITSNPPFYE